MSLTNRFPKYLERRLKNLNPLRMLNSLTESLRAGADLTAEQVTDSVAHMTAEAIPPEAKADLGFVWGHSLRQPSVSVSRPC